MIIKRKKILAVLFAIIMLFSFCGCSNNDNNTDTIEPKTTTSVVLTDSVNFTNGVFGNAVASALGKKSSEELTMGDLADVKVVFIGDMGVQLGYSKYVETYDSSLNATYPLDDIEFPPMMNGEYASDAGMISAADLQKFSNLEYLALTSYSQPTKVSDYSVLPNLRHFVIFMGNTPDLSGINDMKKLESLVLGNSGITDISALKDNKTIKSLTISYTKELKDYTAISTMTQLEYLAVDNASLENVDFVKPLTNLTRLQMANNLISDISSVESLTKLQILNLNMNRLTSLKGMEGLTALKDFKASSNQIKDAIPLYSLTGLANVSLTLNPDLADKEALGKALSNTKVLVDDDSTTTTKIAAN